MTAWRLDPPNSMFSHWSRVVDAPLAGLILLFRTVLDPIHAERAARIVFPALLTLGLFVAGLHAGRIFAGRSMRRFGVAAMLFCGVLFWQFPAGRIDHLAPQIVALLAPVAWSREKLEAVVSVETRPLIGGLAGLLALFGLSSMGVMIALPEGAFAAPPKPDRCMKSETYAPLRDLPAGVAASMISPGASLLAETDLSALAGPYHRNNHGNRATLDILFATPDRAENLARTAGVRYIILCWDRPDAAASWTQWGARGLAAQIIEGAVPRWLRPIPIADTPARVFEVASAGPAAH